MERSFILLVITLGLHWQSSATTDYCLNRYICECVFLWCKESMCSMFCVSVQIGIKNVCLYIFVCVGAVHSIWWGLLRLQPWLCPSNWFPWRSVWSPDTTATFWRQRLRHSCREVCSQAFSVYASENITGCLTIMFMLWRWTTPDISTWTHVGKDPQPFNLYMFRGNNPISKIHQVKEYVTGNKNAKEVTLSRSRWSIRRNWSWSSKNKCSYAIQVSHL